MPQKATRDVNLELLSRTLPAIPSNYIWGLARRGKADNRACDERSCLDAGWAVRLI